jgi:hypothetical protein
MVGIITEPITANRGLDRLGTDAVPATTAEVTNAQIEDQLTRNPLSSLFREVGRARQDTAGIIGEMNGDQKAPRLMEPDEANERYGIEGKLKFDAATTEGVAAELNQLKRDELQREDVFRRAQGGIGQFTARFAGGLVATAMDPLNVASAFIPVVGPSRYALWLERAGSAASRAGIRAGVGAAEGAVGAALVEPLVLGGSRAEQADYGATDSMLNIAFGTVLGGGLHTAFGAVADSVTGHFARQVDAAPMEIKEGALRTSISQVAEGRPVDVEAFFPPNGNPERAINRVLREDRTGWTDPMDRAAAQEVNGLSTLARAEQAKIPDDGDAKALLEAALTKLARTEVRIDEPEFRAAEQSFSRSESISRAYQAAGACLSGRIS